MHLVVIELPAAFSLIPWLGLAGAFVLVMDRVFPWQIAAEQQPAGQTNFSCLSCGSALALLCVFLTAIAGVVSCGRGLYPALNLFGVEASMLNLLPLLPVIFSLPPCRRPCAPQRSHFGLCCFQIMKARWQRLDSFSTISLFCLTRLLACYFGGVRNEISLGLNFSIHMTWEISIWRA